MKSLQQIQDEYARKEGFDNWEHLKYEHDINSIDREVNKVTELYAQECVREALQKYGVHTEDCELELDHYGDIINCTCGLSGLLTTKTT